MNQDPFGTLRELELASGATGKFHSLPALEAAGVGKVSRLPVSIRVVLESVLLGLAGGCIGLLGGLTTALFIQYASQPLLGHPIRATIRPAVILANILAAVAVTALAAWIPARRAARLDLLEAIAAD